MKIKLTDNEKFYLWRRRSGLTQSKFAKKLGVSTEVLRTWEFPGPYKPGHFSPEWYHIVPKDYELAHIARRRKGWSITKAAKQIGISHVTLLRREKGERDYQALVRWWANRGWK